MIDKLKKAWYLLYPLIIYLGVSVVVQAILSVIFSAIFMLLHPNAYGDSMMNDMLAFVNGQLLFINAVSQIVIIPLLAICFYSDHSKKKVESFGRYQSAPFWGYLLIVPISVGFCCGFNRLISLLPQNLSADYEEIAVEMFSADLWIQVLSIVILAGVVEELLFRGVIYKRLSSMMSTKKAMVASAFMFGVFHGNLVQFLYAFALGLVLAYLYEKFKSLYAPMLLHMVANGVSVYMSSDAGQVLTPLWEVGLVYFGVMVMEIFVAGVLLKVIDNEINLRLKENAVNLEG